MMPLSYRLLVAAIAFAIFTISVLLWIGVFEFIGWIAQ